MSDFEPPIIPISPFFLEIKLCANFSGKNIHDVLLHEGRVQGMTTVRTPEVRITVVDFKVSDLDRGDLHQIIPEFSFERRFVELDESTLHPNFVVVFNKQICGKIQTNTICQTIPVEPENLMVG